MAGIFSDTDDLLFSFIPFSVLITSSHRSRSPVLSRYARVKRFSMLLVVTILRTAPLKMYSSPTLSGKYREESILAARSTF